MPRDVADRVRRDTPARNRRPVYVDRLAPCSAACPAGEHVQAWLAEAQAGQYRRAWEIIVRDNPLPAVHGRVCYHPCEDACNRREVDDTISIHAVERFLGDVALAAGWTVSPAHAPSGRRVLVVGAGPSGLSVAWHLAHLGHTVVIHEASSTPGGMMRVGIPTYRLPREVLDGEIGRIRALGVEILLNHRVEDLMAEKAAGRFDAVFVAVGAHLSKQQDVHGQRTGTIYDALPFLHACAAGERPAVGRRVAVFGGGNTAMDAARSASRLGASVTVFYRRTRAQMPAHDSEVQDAMQEGVRIEWLRTLSKVDGTTLTLDVMALDDAGAPRSTGGYDTVEADTVILALGQESDTAFLTRVPGVRIQQDGTIAVDPEMQTGCLGVFAGGDAVPFDRTVTTAVAHGKRAAAAIDWWLRDEPHSPAPQHALATYETLRLWYHTRASQHAQPTLDMDHRRQTFDEVVRGFSVEAARYEAQRCLSCGTCFECDGCYSACPEGAVIKLGPGRRYAFDLDRCTGCAMCYDQCPCGAITMVREADQDAVVGSGSGQGAGA